MTHYSRMASTAPTRNSISIDVEDWLQSVVDPNVPLTDRFCRNTEKVLETLARFGVQGTFFVLGLAAEKAPNIVRAIQEAGHEVQSHGYGHRLVHTLTPEQFRADLDRSKKLLEDITGSPITGYRAPAFTVTLHNLWALDVLVECGFRYDSSVFPVPMRRYGIDGAPHYIHRLKTPSGQELIELPVASYRLAGRRIPTGGGGYFRLFPYFLLRRTLRQLNAEGHGGTVYLHPHEYDPIELGELDYPVPWKLRMHQGLGRKGFPQKIDRLLSDFEFVTMQEQIDSCKDLPIHEYRRSNGQ